jgi:exonuclease VII large subunit
LRRGFAILSRLDGPVVRSTGELRPGDRVTARLADGSVVMVVEE